MFGLIRKWRRDGLLKDAMPEEWLGYLKQHVPFFEDIPEEKREDFLDAMRIFIAEKEFVSANGMEITDEVKVVIAATAVRLTLHLSIDMYNRLSEIVDYPTDYRHPDDEDGIVYGEAHDWGVVVLSWPAVLRGLKNQQDGLDTATHEFAHVLDRAGGQFNGTPELRDRGDFSPWAEVMSRHYLDLREQESKGARHLLRHYGAQNEAEFFAVATEAFFEQGEKMKRKAPDLYEELRQFYGWDPAADEDE